MLDRPSAAVNSTLQFKAIAKFSDKHTEDVTTRARAAAIVWQPSEKVDMVWIRSVDGYVPRASRQFFPCPNPCQNRR